MSMSIDDYIQTVKKKSSDLHIRQLKKGLLDILEKTPRYNDWIIAALYFLYKRKEDNIANEEYVKFLKKVLSTIEHCAPLNDCFPKRRRNKIKDILYENEEKRRSFINIIKASVLNRYQPITSFNFNKAERGK